MNALNVIPINKLQHPKTVGQSKILNNSIILPNNNLSTENTVNQLNYSTQMMDEGSQETASIEDSILKPDKVKHKRTFYGKKGVSRTHFNNSPLRDQKGSLNNSAIQPRKRSQISSK